MASDATAAENAAAVAIQRVFRGYEARKDPHRFLNTTENRYPESGIWSSPGYPVRHPMHFQAARDYMDFVERPIARRERLSRLGWQRRLRSAVVLQKAYRGYAARNRLFPFHNATEGRFRSVYSKLRSGPKSVYDSRGHVRHAGKLFSYTRNKMMQKQLDAFRERRKIGGIYSVLRGRPVLVNYLSSRPEGRIESVRSSSLSRSRSTSRATPSNQTSSVKGSARPSSLKSSSRTIVPEYSSMSNSLSYVKNGNKWQRRSASGSRSSSPIIQSPPVARRTSPVTMRQFYDNYVYGGSPIESYSSSSDHIPPFSGRSTSSSVSGDQIIGRRRVGFKNVTPLKGVKYTGSRRKDGLKFFYDEEDNARKKM